MPRPYGDSVDRALVDEERPLGGWGWLLAGMCVFNFFVFPFIRAVEGGGRGMLFIGATAFGLFPAQLGALTLWLVWGPGPLAIRLGKHWLAALALFASWALGAAIVLADGPVELPAVLGAVLCSLPLVSLAAQLPLWPLRTHLGWRVEGGPVTPASLINQPLFIRDILIGTVVTAVSLAGIRIVAAITDSRQAGGQMEPRFWFGWGIAVLIIAAISLLGFLPATWLLLRGREPAPRLGLWLAYVAVATLVIILVIAAIAGPIPDAEPVVSLVCLAGSFAGALAVPLLLVRSHGWRLILPGELAPTLPPEVHPQPSIWQPVAKVAEGDPACDIPGKEQGG